MRAYVGAFGVEETMSRLHPPRELRRMDLELEDLIRA